MGNLHRLEINEPSFDKIQCFVEDKLQIPMQYQRLWHNGKRIDATQSIASHDILSIIRVSLCLQGGKGGFGSMLRAAGKLNKTTNRSACRDLSGRRQRFIEQEKELREWLAAQKDAKPMSQKEIQNDFRHIKEFGTLPEKRMCHRGIRCKHRNQCLYVHPDDANDENDRAKKIQKEQQSLREYQFEPQTDEDMQNALAMGQLN